jgi:hypothetical protein
MHTVRFALSIASNKDKLEGVMKFPPHLTVQGKTIENIRKQLYQDVDNILDAYVEINPDIKLVEEGIDILNDI